MVMQKTGRKSVTAMRPAIPRMRFLSSAEDERRIAELQRQDLRGFADLIERGELPTDELAWMLIAATLRGAADSIPDKPKRGRGQAAKFDPGQAALSFAILVVRHGMSRNAARESLAERYSVSVEAVKKALQKHGDGEPAIAFLESMRARKPNK